jgi:hypothetical protein
MTPTTLISLPATLLAILASPALAQLPYNPTRIIVNSNGTFAYIFAPNPSSSQFSFSVLDTSNSIDSTNLTSTLDSALPFLSESSSKAFIPLADSGGDITVLAGDCQEEAQGLELWRFSPNTDQATGTWTNLELTLVDSTLSANYLSAGFTFSPTSSPSDVTVYVFGGMCPQQETSTISNWTLDATFSNTMLTLSPNSTSPSNSVPYELSLTGQRAPPIAEAGLSITPLMPTYSNTSTGNVSQQQNFVLIGGHTQNAFINMSQVALFSLPEQSWAFLSIDQPSGMVSSTELLPRDSDEVAPRSGHTAVMTPDGSKIVVFGGWVGNVNTPATPQLAILEIGQGFGGTGNWAWTIPSQVSNPFATGEGVYGHGATMLPGGVMMISGGRHISASGSNTKRQTSNQFLFFNTTSSSWISTYINPSSPNSPAYVPPAPPNTSSSLKTASQGAGLGAGLGLGFAALVGIIIFLVLYRRRRRQRRAVREKELRELALGTEIYNTSSIIAAGVDGRGGHPEMRTASWGSRQEQRIENAGDVYPWAPPDQAERIPLGYDDQEGNGMRHAERTGVLVEVPSPTRGLRRGMHSRGPTTYGANFGPAPGGAPSVFRIEEEEEGSQGGSIRRVKTPARDSANRISDPFKDPPPVILPGPVANQGNPAAEERKKEVQGWVEDWNAAAESMNISRNPSKATTQDRTSSNLSNSQPNTHSGSQSGRGSPEKSDRTGSNLSERSMISNYSGSQAESVSRNRSTRSAGTGYALFAGAAAAMAAKAKGEFSKPAYAEYGAVNTGRGSLARAPSRRSTSANINSIGSSQWSPGERTETFSTARDSIGSMFPSEDHSLLAKRNSCAISDEKDYWATPPESPIKNRYPRADSFGSQAGRRAFGLLGSVRRVFTGTGTVDVKDQVTVLEGRSNQSSPTKHSNQPDMVEGGPRRTVSAGAAFWRGKRGAKDWDEDDGHGVGPSSTVRRKPVSGQSVETDDGSENGDWDVETAIQNRVVQVMFTVPKEKLRVVNADALSLLSKSDVDFEGGENDGDKADMEKVVKRMSSVREVDDLEDDEGREKAVDDETTQQGKGKKYEFND